MSKISTIVAKCREIEETVGHIKKGAFHAWLGKSEDQPITAADIAKGKAAGGHAAKMATFAQNFGHVGESFIAEGGYNSSEHMIVHEKTGKEIKVGSKVKGFRGTYHVQGFTPPQHSSSSGRVHTDKGSFFPGVVNGKIVRKDGKKDFPESVQEGLFSGPKHAGITKNDKVLDTTNDFQHWKKIIKQHHPKSMIDIHGTKATAKVGEHHTVGAWDHMKKEGHVLHQPQDMRESVEHGSNPHDPLVMIHSKSEPKINGKMPMVGHMNLSTASHIYGVPHLSAIMDMKKKGYHVHNGKHYTVSQHQKVWENVEINELSKSTLSKYIHKAATSVHNSGFKAGEHYSETGMKAFDSSGEKTPFLHHTMKSLKRQVGIGKAATKLAREHGPKEHAIPKQTKALLTGESIVNEDLHKVGTKVMVNKPTSIRHGKIGTVTTRDKEHVHKVRFPGGESTWFHGVDLVPEVQHAHESVEINEVRIGDHIHLGFGAKGGAGYRGKVIDVDNGTVHIREHEPTGMSLGGGSHYKEYKGPVSHATIEKSVSEGYKHKNTLHAKLRAAIAYHSTPEQHQRDMRIMVGLPPDGPAKHAVPKQTKALLTGKSVVNETIPAGASAETYIHDFVKSKNKMFAGDSTKKRIKRALGAYYGSKNESLEEGVKITPEHGVVHGIIHNQVTNGEDDDKAYHKDTNSGRKTETRKFMASPHYKAVRKSEGSYDWVENVAKAHKAWKSGK